MYILKLLGLVSLTLLSQACAVGNRHMLNDLDATVQLRGSGPVAIATEDARPYILNGDKRANFVGLQRAGYGNPFDVTTASGKSLAEDLTSSLDTTLRAAGYEPMPIVVTATNGESTLVAALVSRGLRRAVLLVIREFKSDTYMNVALHYDLTLKVIDATGAVLADTQAHGTDNVGGSFVNPPAAAKKGVPPAVRRRLQELLDAPQVQNALR